MYLDTHHPAVQAVARQMKQHATSQVDIVRNIFYYVRDDILFGFHTEVDALSAGEIIERGRGQCNNKSIVFTALCRALDIPVRLFFSDIDSAIHRGFIPAWASPLFPKYISHSWVEVQVDGQWHRVDAYINDEGLFRAGRAKLLELGWQVGYSVADPTQASSEFSLNSATFVQMAAVTQSHGSYDDPAVYFNSSLYRNQPNGLRRLLSAVVLRAMERRVRQVRADYLGQAAAQRQPSIRSHAPSL